MSWKHHQYLSCWVKIKFPCPLALEKHQTADYCVSSVFKWEWDGRPGVCPLWTRRARETGSREDRPWARERDGRKRERACPNHPGQWTTPADSTTGYKTPVRLLMSFLMLKEWGLGTEVTRCYWNFKASVPNRKSWGRIIAGSQRGQREQKRLKRLKEMTRDGKKRNVRATALQSRDESRSCPRKKTKPDLLGLGTFLRWQKSRPY